MEGDAYYVLSEEGEYVKVWSEGQEYTGLFVS
jgi:hypothetical protein